MELRSDVTVLNDPGSHYHCAYDWPPLEKDRFLSSGNQEMAWKKYCGFLEFSVEEYSSIQKLLLNEQIEILMCFPLGQEIMGGHQAENVEAYRRLTPLTGYPDYRDWFENKKPLELNEKALFWSQSPENCGLPRRVPFTLSRTRALVDDVISALILSAAGSKGEVKLESLSKILISLGDTAISEAISIAISQRLECENLTSYPLTVDAETQIDRGFRKGIDFVISESPAIAQSGQNLEYSTLKTPVLRWNPQVLIRLLKTWRIARFKQRPVLAKDLWNIKGIICCDDMAFLHTDEIERVWGVRPLQVYFKPEGGFMAVQAWNKKGLTFIPYRNFYEFIPLPEIEKEAADDHYQPATQLMNELKAGEVYELVITSFHGGPFLRYRTGDYLKVLALNDPETGVDLPQFILYEKPAISRGLIS